MESSETSKNLSAAPAASFNSHIPGYQRDTSSTSSISAVGVYEQRPRRRALPVLLLIGLLATVVISAFLLGKVLF